MPFRQATEFVSSATVPTLSSTYMYYIALQNRIRVALKQMPIDAPLALSRGLQEAHRKLAEYLSLLHESPFCLWATRKFLFLACK